MLNLQLVSYLIDNQIALLLYPVCGRLTDIHCLFSLYSTKYSECQSPPLTFPEFIKDIKDLARTCPGCVNYTSTQEISSELGGNFSLEFIDVGMLKILYNLFRPGGYSVEEGQRAKQELGETPRTRLLQLLDGDDYVISNKGYLLSLENLLNICPASRELSRECAKVTTALSNYIPVCGNKSHATILASGSQIVGNNLISIQWQKLRCSEDQRQVIENCVNSRIHYIPNIKPQTDLNLGDCSYLDTCHKLNSCRYAHYVEYIPDITVQEALKNTDKLNRNKHENLKTCFYTHGYSCTVGSKSQIPPQWIKCDVRKFDFSVLGKFSVVIADPAWNIHMNLPYGTCNDSELFQLPLDTLQEEGIIFLWVTGRAVEVGKDSLQKWGYTVSNEIAWIKTNQLGRTIVTGRTGHWLNHSKEHLLVGIKGNPSWLNKQIDVDLIVSPTRETSRKPDELYGMIERIVGPHSRKLEIFGRDHNTRPGWFTIGNQLDGHSIHEPDVKKRYEKFVGGECKTAKFMHSTKPGSSTFGKICSWKNC